MKRNQLLYLLSSRPALNYKALYADMTENYVNPMEPEPNSMVTLTFRTAYKNVDSVNYVSDDWKAEMEFVESIEDFAYYETRVWIGAEPLKYHFEIKLGRVVAAYDMSGVVRKDAVNHPFVQRERVHAVIRAACADAHVNRCACIRPCCLETGIFRFAVFNQKAALVFPGRFHLTGYCSSCKRKDGKVCPCVRRRGRARTAL